MSEGCLSRVQVHAVPSAANRHSKLFITGRSHERLQGLDAMRCYPPRWLDILGRRVVTVVQVQADRPAVNCVGTGVMEWRSKAWVKYETRSLSWQEMQGFDQHGWTVERWDGVALARVQAAGLSAR